MSVPVTQESGVVVINSFPNPTGGSGGVDDGFKLFKIENADGVLLPGCSEVTEIRLDNRVIPAYIDHQVPIDSTMTRFETHRHPNYSLVDSPDGKMLIRSMGSNDGKWQVGSTLHVKGTFTDDKKAAATK